MDYKNIFYFDIVKLLGYLIELRHKIIYAITYGLVIPSSKIKELIENNEFIKNNFNKAIIYIDEEKYGYPIGTIVNESEYFFNQLEIMSTYEDYYGMNLRMEVYKHSDIEDDEVFDKDSNGNYLDQFDVIIRPSQPQDDWDYIYLSELFNAEEWVWSQQIFN